MSGRNIIDVAGKIRDVVPEDAPGRESLASAVLHIERTAGFTAPELMSGLWGLLADVVTSVAGQPPLTESWKIEMVAILTDKSVEEARKAYAA